jgi:hypothetical protein
MTITDARKFRVYRECVEGTPRSWLYQADQADFGRRGERRWRVASSVEEQVGLAAAQLQHDVVVACRPRLEELQMSVADLASRLADDVPRVRTKPDMLRRKFRGEARASIDDLAAWLTVLDVPRRWRFGDVQRGDVPASTVSGPSYDSQDEGRGAGMRPKRPSTRAEVSL